MTRTFTHYVFAAKRLWAKSFNTISVKLSTAPVLPLWTDIFLYRALTSIRCIAPHDDRREELGHSPKMDCFGRWLPQKGLLPPCVWPCAVKSFSLASVASSEASAALYHPAYTRSFIHHHAGEMVLRAQCAYKTLHKTKLSAELKLAHSPLVKQERGTPRKEAPNRFKQLLSQERNEQLL